MKKKIIIIIVIIVLLIPFIPRIYALNDGGTKIYRSLIYEITKVHKMKKDHINEYDDGTVIKIFGIEIFNDVEEEKIDNAEIFTNVEDAQELNINIENLNNNVEKPIEEKQEEKQEENEKKEESMSKIYIKINDRILDVELEENAATKDLKEKLKSGDVVVKAHEYGGFEKVGDLGFLLPTEDTSITTSAGDIVLYQGNQVSIFYNSNSWSYTMLGKIQGVNSNELKSILGSGDITVTFSLSK